MGDKYTELFEVSYSGNVGDLTSHIKSAAGVERASTSEPSHRNIESSVQYEIKYDTHLTDRTELALYIEGFSGVDEVTFA